MSRKRLLLFNAVDAVIKCIIAVELKFLKHGCPRSKNHNNRRTVQQRTTEGTATRRNNGTIGGPKCTSYSPPLWYKWFRAISRLYRLKKTASKQSKRRDLHLKWLHRVTNDNTLYYSILFISKSFNITRKPVFAHFGEHEKSHLT